MAEPRNYQTEAIVVKKIKLGEADRVLTLLTPNLGKIRAVAKGVRRPKSKMAGHLELLTHSQITLARGRNLDTITGSQTINSFVAIKSDLRLTSYALYLAELTEQFTAERVENETIFQSLLSTYIQICQAGCRDYVLRLYEMGLLGMAGFQPELRHCVRCRQVLEPVDNAFSATLGGVLCPACAREQSYVYNLSVNALKVLRLIQSNDTQVLSRLKINTELANEVEEVLRHYIKYLLEKDLKSTEWLDSLRTNGADNSGFPQDTLN